jgi:hypothetical protein
MITPAAAVEAARYGIENYSLHEHIRAGLDFATINAEPPIMVRRLDVPGRDYYLVPWVAERGIVLVVQVDASTGVMSNAVPLPNPLSRLVISPEEAQRAVDESWHPSVMGEPRLVWCPCRESSSPFQPFYQIATEKGEAFVGVDGSVYPRLTPFGKGG